MNPSIGETCTMCGAPASFKVGQEWPQSEGHNMTAYVCAEHHRQIFMPYVVSPIRSEAAESVRADWKDLPMAKSHVFEGETWPDEPALQSEQDGDAELLKFVDYEEATTRNAAHATPARLQGEKDALYRRADKFAAIAARLRSLPEPEWSPAYINALLEVEGLSRAVHGALVNEPEKLQCDSFCGPEECLFCDWTRALEKMSHLPSSPSRSLPVKSEPEAWLYELAGAITPEGTYTHWNEHLTRHEPHVPEGSIRNLTPLFSRVQPIANNVEETSRRRRD